MQGMIDLALQFAEPHAAARKEGAGRFDPDPGAPEISLGEHAIQEGLGDPKIDGEFRRERLPPPGSPNPAAEVVAPIRVYGGLNLLVGEFILSLHAATDGIGHAARRSTDCARRYRDNDRRIMPDPCVDAGERANECAVLAGRKCRNATTTTKCRLRYRQTRTCRLGMARQGIGGIRIEPIRYAIEQLDQPAFQRIVGLEVGWDQRCLQRMEYDASAHNLGTRGNCLAIALDPIRRRHGVGVRCQENAIRPHPLFRQSHGQPTRLTCIGALHWEVMALYIQSVGQRRRQPGDNRRRSITAIVGEYHHGVRAACLVSQREETRLDAFGLVLRRKRNNDEVLVHPTMRSARCFAEFRFR